MTKRAELHGTPTEMKESAKALAALPRAAALYREQIQLGLGGDPRESLKARAILRDIFGGKIVLEPGEDGTLWANFEVHPAMLVRG